MATYLKIQGKYKIATIYPKYEITSLRLAKYGAKKIGKICKKIWLQAFKPLGVL